MALVKWLKLPFDTLRSSSPDCYDINLLPSWLSWMLMRDPGGSVVSTHLVAGSD